jgi:hypothetical protein
VDGEGPASVRDIQQSPEAGRPNLGLDRKHETPWHVEDFTGSWAVRHGMSMQYGISNRWHEVIAHFDSLAAAQAIVDVANIREARLPEQDPDDAVAEWIGEAVPVIRDVLRSHMLRPDWGRTAMCQCLHMFRSPTAAEDWRNHVAALIANTLAPHDK